jgi:hypothetical protein
MVKSNTNISNTNADTNINSSGVSYSANTNTNTQDFNESVNRALDQTKDNINRSITESQSQIPKYNSIVNSYQEQALQTAREISENFIESQKSVIHSIQSAWRPFSQNFNTTVNSWYSPETATNAYSRFVSTVSDNTVAALRNTNNLIFSSLDAFKTTMEHARQTTKQIFDLNAKTAKTLEQNTRQMTAAAQDSASRFNASINSSNGSGSSNTTSTGNKTAGTSTSTTVSTDGA